MTVLLRDPVNPIFKANRTKYYSVESPKTLRVNFHPACLLTLGDTRAFMAQLGAASPAAPALMAGSAPRLEQPPGATPSSYGYMRRHVLIR